MNHYIDAPQKVFMVDYILYPENVKRTHVLAAYSRKNAEHHTREMEKSSKINIIKITSSVLDVEENEESCNHTDDV